MPDLTAALLVFVTIILTIILIIFSIQIYFIFCELRKNLKDFDKILINLGHLSGKIDDTVSSAALVSLGAKVVHALISLVHQDKNGERS